MPTLKQCIDCKETKSLTEFHKQYNTPDGHRYNCKLCHIKYQHARNGMGYEASWRKRDWPRYLATVRQYRRTPGGYYTSLKYRKNPVEFSRQEFIEWDAKQARKCYYCDIPESTMVSLSQFYKKRGTGDFYRLTIDRKDNAKFYTLDNIVLACPRCNETKGDFFSSEEFIQVARKYIRPKWKKLISSSAQPVSPGIGDY